MKPQELDDRLNDVDEKWKTIQNERRNGKPDVGKKSESNLLTSMQKIEDRLEAFRVNASNKDEVKDVSLGTSKINYIDPRITVAWCKEYEVPVEKVFAKTLLTKFTWAMETTPDWKF